jgi:regulator of sigma E protease
VLSVNGRPVTDLPALEREVVGATGPELTLQIVRRVPADVPGSSERAPGGDGAGAAAGRHRHGGLRARASGRLLPPLRGPGAPRERRRRRGHRRGDRLEAVSGKQIRSREQLFRRLAELKDRSFRLTWIHDGLPREAEVRMRPAKAAGDGASGDGEAFELGIRFESGTPGDKGSDAKVRVGPGLALVTAAHRLGEAVADTAAGLAKLLTGQVSLKNVGGPIMIYGIAGKAAQAGLDYFLNLMALISVNLGLINLVPIPALDGFQLLSAGWEAVRRRPIPIRAREIANAVGIVALIVLMVLVCVNDLTR